MKLLMRKVGVFGVLLNLVPGQMLWAGEEVSPAIQTVVLHPAATPPLRIDFNYNFRNALPPFEKEPVFPGKELARGLIPTVPPTPLLRNISDNELYLNLDHLQDFVTGKPPPKGPCKNNFQFCWLCGAPHKQHYADMVVMGRSGAP
jgi:hypothetical protein